MHTYSIVFSPLDPEDLSGAIPALADSYGRLIVTNDGYPIRLRLS